MSFKVGRSCKVAIGSNKVSGMGTVTLSGVESDLLDKTEFGDTWKQWEVGLKDGGELTFEGLFDPDDTNGQEYLRSANENNTEVTDIRFYVDANSYYIPATTNPSSHVKITRWEVNTAVNEMVRTSFTCKISGKMELL